MAEIWMVFGAEEYKYGTYRFVTRAEKNRVNDLAMQIREERGCETYVKEIPNHNQTVENVCNFFKVKDLRELTVKHFMILMNKMGEQ